MADGIGLLTDPVVWLVIVGGILIGLIFGLMPGIGVASAMAIVLPLTFGMNPMVALALLMSIHAVGCTGGSVTAILLNIPGTGLNAATLLDGFPMTKKGQGGRAVGAALFASGLGGFFGAVVLALMIPAVRPIVMAFGSAETMLVALTGLTFISVLSTESKVKGLASGLLGMLIGFIGVDPLAGVPRFTMGSMYLYDGIGLIPLVLGMFALTEVIDLTVKARGTIADVDKSAIAQAQLSQVWEGVKDVIRHWKLFIRSSVIGTVTGIIPGVGGATAVFMAYGQAKLTSKHPELFGQGCIEGVIAPEAANNAKEGGSMLPTLAFGVPGALLMAILLAVFMIHGIAPGPSMLKEHLDLTWALIFVLVISNFLGAAILLPFAMKLANIAFVRSSILIPVILVIACFGAYAYNNEFWDIVGMVVFGIMGYAMVRSGYNRVTMLLGFILAPIVERYWYIAYEAEGLAFLLKPVDLVLLGLIVFIICYYPVKDLIRARRKGKP